MKEKEAIDIIKNTPFVRMHNLTKNESELYEALNMAIAALDKQKHGNWFLLDECANTGVYCSVCHKKVYKSDYANQKIKSKFCPNCGAIMDGKFKEL